MTKEVLIITEELLEKGKSLRGSWNRRQLKLLGINQPYKGWQRNIIGRTISKENAQKFLLLKNNHLRKMLKRTEKEIEEVDKMIEKQLRIEGINFS